MSVQLNHLIVWCNDPEASSKFYARILGLRAPETFAHFKVVRADNAVSLDFMLKEDGKVAGQHYAFLVDEAQFDLVLGRIRAEGVKHWADPGQSKPNEINHHDGGRGVYFVDPNGHLLEILTRPYGSGSA